MATTNINIRTTSELKEDANSVLSRLGLDMSTAINLFLRQVVDKNAIPFSLTISHVKKQAKLGAWEGKVRMSDDFDEPMDEYGRFESDPDYCTPVKEAWER